VSSPTQMVVKKCIPGLTPSCCDTQDNSRRPDGLDCPSDVFSSITKLGVANSLLEKFTRPAYTHEVHKNLIVRMRLSFATVLEALVGLDVSAAHDSKHEHRRYFRRAATAELLRLLHGRGVDPARAARLAQLAQLRTSLAASAAPRECPQPVARRSRTIHTIPSTVPAVTTALL